MLEIVKKKNHKNETIHSSVWNFVEQQDKYFSKNQFWAETMETNLSASLNQPHKASRETTEPKKHFISQQGGVRRTSPIIDWGWRMHPQLHFL